MAARSKRTVKPKRGPVAIDFLEGRCLLSAAPPRVMENLGRGLIAMRTGTTNAFLSWRLLGLDPSGIGFNVYRSTNGGTAQKLNASPLTGGTNYTDNGVLLTVPEAYYVRPVINGVEQAPSASFILAANSPTQPMFSFPLRNISGTASDYYVHLSWVGDLDGDGEYDFVVDRIPNIAGLSDKVEAYKRDGTFLWAVDMGPNSLNKNNIEPSSSTISVGNWDGVTVSDFDCDGKAEVAVRTANGVIFGDGSTLSFPSNNNIQFISILNGMTGAERARIQVPTDYLTDGPMACSMGVGYLNGVTPSLVCKMKNRIGSGAFNLMVLAYDFDGTTITQKWKWKRTDGTANPDGHQIRIVDVDQDGRDEVVDIGYVLDGGGTLKYSMGPTVTHGDRTQIGDLDPDRPGLEGYAVQQDNPSGLLEYYYDAANGQILHSHFTSTPPVDVGRGIAADVDPAHRGYEYWSFSGIYSSTTTTPGQAPVETQLTVDPKRPWPNFRIWWDGDVLSENLDETKLDKWNPATQSSGRLLSAYQLGAVESWRGAPTFYGDIFGDWREEIIYEKSDHTQLQIFSTTTPSSTRIYTLAQDPEYRNSMTVKGYMQSHMLDYYLGDGMATPPTPNIIYARSNTPPVKYTYQAENASIGGGATLAISNAGYNGTGYIDSNSTGGFVQFNNVNGGAGGWATLSFRNALSSGTRTGTLTVNGVSQNITFGSSTSFTNWIDKNVAIYLNPGATNTIRLQSTGQDLANIDQLVVATLADITAPTIPDASHHYDASPNTLVFTFSEPVNAHSGDLIITFEGGGSVAIAGFDNSSNTVTYTLPQQLGDGNYRATFSNGAVQDLSGNPLANGYSFDFFVLGGDANHDRSVDLFDMIIFNDNWLGSGKTFSQGDFNYDGNVNAADLTIVAHHWQQRLDQAAQLAPALSAVEIAPAGPVSEPTQVMQDVVQENTVEAPSISEPVQAVINPPTPAIALPVAVVTEPIPVITPIAQPPILPLVPKPVAQPVATAGPTTTKTTKLVNQTPIATPAKKPISKAVAKSNVKSAVVSKEGKIRKAERNAIATLHAPPPTQQASQKKWSILRWFD